MRIQIFEELTSDDIKEINEAFNYDLPLSDNTEYVKVETSHLVELEELDWIQWWLDIWYSLQYNKDLDLYTLEK